MYMNKSDLNTSLRNQDINRYKIKNLINNDQVDSNLHIDTQISIIQYQRTYIL